MPRTLEIASLQIIFILPIAIVKIWSNITAGCRRSADYAAGNVISGNGNDPLTGTAGSDRIIGGKGRDLLTGGGGSDQFSYTQLRDVGDRITDFVVGEDLALSPTDLFTRGQGTISDLATAKSQGFISFVDRNPHTVVMLDPDGSSGLRGRYRPLAVIQNVIESDMDAAGNFIF